MPTQNEFSDRLPSVERLIQRVRAAEQTHQRDIRLTIQEARELVQDLALLTAKLSGVLADIQQSIAAIDSSGSGGSIKMDGGSL